MSTGPRCARSTVATQIWKASQSMGETTPHVDLLNDKVSSVLAGAKLFLDEVGHVVVEEASDIAVESLEGVLELCNEICVSAIGMAEQGVDHVSEAEKICKSCNSIERLMAGQDESGSDDDCSYGGFHDRGFTLRELTRRITISSPGSSASA